MNESQPLGNSDQVLPQEFVSQSILRRFPKSSIKIRESKTDQIFDIYLEEKLLLTLDKKGARYFFPSRRKRVIKWEKFSSTGLVRIIEYILRDLAEANYEVLSSTDKPILKRPVHISRLLRCPECNQGGAIKIIVSKQILAEDNSEIYTSVSPDSDLNGAQIKCTLCGWIGIREQLLRKARRRFSR